MPKQFDLTKFIRNIEQFKRQQAEPIRKRIKILEVELDGLRQVLSDLDGNGTPARRPGRPAGSTAAKTTAKKATGGGKRRKKRSKEEMTKYGHAIADFISSSKDGRTGAEIRQKFPHIGEGTTIRAFVKTHAGINLRVTGKLRDMKYHYSAA